MNIRLELPKDTMIMTKNELKLALKELVIEIEGELRKDNVMTIKETAEYLKVSIPTVRSMIARREIPYFQKGQVIRLKLSEVQKWMSDNANF